MSDKERSILTNGVRISNKYTHVGWDSDNESAEAISGTKDNHTVVIQIPMSMFGPKPQSLLNMSCKPAALAIQEALSVFSFLVQNPSLCVPLTEEEAEQKLVDVLEARLGSEQILRFTDDDGEQDRERIQVGMEMVTTAGADGGEGSVSGTVIAYRIHIMVIDRLIDLGTGLYHLIRYNKAQAKKLKARGGFQSRFDRSVIGPSTYYKRVTSTAYWSYTIASQYLRSEELHSLADQVESVEAPLQSKDNPANPYFVFSLKNACRLTARPDVTTNIEGDPCPLQSNYVNYISPGPYAEVIFPKPRLTVKISQLVFAPEVVNLFQLPSLTAHGIIEEPAESLGALDAYAIILRKIGGQFSDPLPGNQQSDLHIIQRESAEVMGNLSKIADTDERREALAHARKCIGNDVKQCFDARANIANPLLDMVIWHESNIRQASARGETLCYSRPVEQVACLDSDLSAFANRRLMDMKMFEEYLEVATTHDTLYTLYVFAMDAYRHEKNLHNNAVLCGGGGVSKSFIMLLLKDMCIPKTTLFVAHVTEHAACIEDDDNYKIECMEEIPMARLGLEKGQGAQGDPKFKNKLTSLETVSTVFHCDEETGRRTARTIVSESVGVVLGATNDPPGEIPDALRQRFFIKRMNMYSRPCRSIMDYKCQHRSEHMKVQKDKVLHSFRTTQMMVAWINQLIWCKALPEVDMGAALTMFKVMIGFLEEKGVVNIANVGRDVSRLKNAARTITIINAVDEVFNTPGKMHWGKPFKFDMLCDVKNGLFCTEEIAWFTFGLLKDMFVDTEECPLLCGLAKHNAFVPLVKGARRIMWDPRYRHSNAVNAAGMIKYRTSSDGVSDFDYIELGCSNLTQLAKKAAKSCMKGVQVSVSNAEMVLKGLEKRTFRCHPRTGPLCNEYNAAALVTKDILFHDTENSMPRYYVLVEYVLYVADIRANTGYGSRADVISDAIGACAHHHVTPRTILTGMTLCDENPRAPQLFRPYQMVQPPGDDLLARVEIAGGETRPFIYTASVDDTEHDRWCDEQLLAKDDPVRTDWRPSLMDQSYKASAVAAGVQLGYVEKAVIELQRATGVLDANRKRKVTDQVDPLYDSGEVAKRRKASLGLGDDDMGEEEEMADQDDFGLFD